VLKSLAVILKVIINMTLYKTYFYLDDNFQSVLYISGPENSWESELSSQKDIYNFFMKTEN